jgi:hypothetical protein
MAQPLKKKKQKGTIYLKPQGQITQRGNAQKKIYKKKSNFTEYSRELQINNFSSPSQNLCLKRLPPWLSEGSPPRLYAVYAEYIILPKPTKLKFSSGKHIQSRQRSPRKEIELVSGGQEMVE